MNFQIEREVESFTGLKHSLFKNEDHLPSLGLDLGGRNSSDVFSVSYLTYLYDVSVPIIFTYCLTNETVIDFRMREWSS